MENVVIVFLLAVVACVLAIPGGSQPVDITDGNIRNMTDFAVAEIGSEYQLGEIISATQQVVNGIIYRIEFTVSVPGVNRQRQCKVAVYEIFHQSYLELEEFQCRFVGSNTLL